MSIGLVLEGGGMRGAYTAGVLTALYHTNIPIDYVIGVSAGALNAMSYISEQPERNLAIFRDFVTDENFISPKNLIKGKALFGYDFIIKELAAKQLPFDFEAYKASQKKFFVGATDCNTGDAVWFPKEEVGEHFDILVASSSLPLVAPIVRYDKYELLDGGIAAPIPIDKSLQDGNEKNIIVLTRNAGYRNTSKLMRVPVEAAFRAYPNLVETLVDRPEIYNATIDLCEILEAQGDALIIRPSMPLDVERYERNPKKLVNLYNEGVSDTISIIQKIKDFVKS